jgi:hypothetical protein
MTTSTTTPKLICAECRRENEAERIFCHNCGERLDRSAVAAETKVDKAQETHRRLQKMMQGPSRTRHNFFAACKLILAAAAAAGLLQMFLPPDFPPAVKVSSPMQLDLELETAAVKPLVLNFSQQDINAYLTYRLAGKRKTLNKPFLDFERAAVVFKEGACVVGWQRSIFGYSIYSQSSFRVDLKGGKVFAISNGGWIGRLPIHPAIMQYANIIFADVFTALDRERRLLSKMGTVEFHDGSVTIASATHQ